MYFVISLNVTYDVMFTLNKKKTETQKKTFHLTTIYASTILKKSIFKDTMRPVQVSQTRKISEHELAMKKLENF